MPQHDPLPDQTGLQRTALAWTRYKRLMRWMAVAAALSALLAIGWLKASGSPLPIHMVIATLAGVGFSVLLGTGLMGLVYFSNNSGHDDAANTRKSDRDV